MEFTIRRVSALCKKELKDFSKNANVFAICLLPIAFAFIYSRMGGAAPSEHMDKTMILLLCLNMNLVMVCSFAMSMLIAEEKEKNTMRTLFLSSVSPLEFLTGKAAVVMGFVIVTNTLMFFIVGMEIQFFFLYTILALALGVVMLELGAVIGLIADNQMATSVVGMPVIMGFLLIPMLADINDLLRRIATLFPYYHLQEVLGKVLRGGTLQTSDNQHALAIVAWVAIGAVIFVYTYNRKGLDK